MDVKRYYEDRLARFGPTREALNISEVGQVRRFEVLAEVGDLRNRTVADLGSGLGDFCAFLRGRFEGIQYTGFDLSEKFVEEARRRYPEARFEARDLLREGVPGSYDYVLSSGMLNIETGTNDADMAALLAAAWKACRSAVAVNLLSRFADRWDPECHVYDPAEFLRVGQRLCRRVVLRHDYLPNDFTIYLLRENPTQ